MLSGASWTALNKFFTCAILSGAKWTILHKVFTCSMLPQDYLDNLEQVFFLCNIVWSHLENIAQGFYLCNIVPRVLRQHWTGFFPMQCCLEPLGQHCTRFLQCNFVSWLTKNFSQQNNLYSVVSMKLGQNCTVISYIQYCPPNTSETTLHKKITGAMLAQTTQSSFRRKIAIYKVVLVCLSQH